MPQVNVTIAGRTYRMACGEGEESHLEGLAALYDGKIEELRGAFGEIGDMRLHVMAAITIADDLTESRRRVSALENEVAELRRRATSGDEHQAAHEARVADGIIKAADRIERLAKSLQPPPPQPLPAAE